MDYEELWQEEIADQWIYDFVISGKKFSEVRVEVTDPNGDVEPDSPEFEIKNVIFTISVDGKIVQLWVFYDFLNEEIAECEFWDNHHDNSEEIGMAVFEINERWKLEKQAESKDD